MFLSGSPLIAKVLKQFSMSPDPHPLRAESENNWPIFEIQFFEKSSDFSKSFYFFSKKAQENPPRWRHRAPCASFEFERVFTPTCVCIQTYIVGVREKKKFSDKKLCKHD